MSPTDLQRFTAACDYPGALDCERVEEQLRAYLAALGVERTVVRLRAGWSLDDHPALARSVDTILDDFARRSPSARDARAALDARDARAAIDALDARAARDARDALDAMTTRHQFAEWCLMRGGWWSWGWDLSWIACTFLGARQNQNPDVIRWSEPVFEAFVAGCWSLYWTDDTLYWVAKPVVHRDATSDTRRLHHDRYAAIENDIQNLYFWHGVWVPAFVVVRPDWITTAHIQTETNVEVRRIMVERYGFARYLTDTDAAIVHADETGTLYRTELPDDEPLAMVSVLNSTPETDGSAKRYMLRVPPAMTTARAAVAWTFDRAAGDYAPVVET